jgi:aldehyde dehydrogenase (NAD+)
LSRQPFTGVPYDLRIAKEEIFGPVPSVIAYSGGNGAVAIANGSAYGLHGAVFTRDHDRAA